MEPLNNLSPTIDPHKYPNKSTAQTKNTDKTNGVAINYISSNGDVAFDLQSIETRGAKETTVTSIVATQTDASKGEGTGVDTINTTDHDKVSCNLNSNAVVRNENIKSPFAINYLFYKNPLEDEKLNKVSNYIRHFNIISHTKPDKMKFATLNKALTLIHKYQSGTSPLYIADNISSNEKGEFLLNKDIAKDMEFLALVHNKWEHEKIIHHFPYKELATFIEHIIILAQGKLISAFLLQKKSDKTLFNVHKENMLKIFLMYITKDKELTKQFDEAIIISRIKILDMILNSKYPSIVMTSEDYNIESMLEEYKDSIKKISISAGNRLNPVDNLKIILYAVYFLNIIGEEDEAQNIIKRVCPVFLTEKSKQYNHTETNNQLKDDDAKYIAKISFFLSDFLKKKLSKPLYRINESYHAYECLEYIATKIEDMALKSYNIYRKNTVIKSFLTTDDRDELANDSIKIQNIIDQINIAITENNNGEINLANIDNLNVLSKYNILTFSGLRSIIKKGSMSTDEAIQIKTYAMIIKNEVLEKLNYLYFAVKDLNEFKKTCLDVQKQLDKYIMGKAIANKDYFEIEEKNKSKKRNLSATVKSASQTLKPDTENDSLLTYESANLDLACSNIKPEIDNVDKTFLTYLYSIQFYYGNIKNTNNIDPLAELNKMIKSELVEHRIYASYGLSDIALHQLIHKVNSLYKTMFSETNKILLENVALVMEEKKDKIPHAYFPSFVNLTALLFDDYKQIKTDLIQLKEYISAFKRENKIAKKPIKPLVAEIDILYLELQHLENKIKSIEDLINQVLYIYQYLYIARSNKPKTHKKLHEKSETDKKLTEIVNPSIKYLTQEKAVNANKDISEIMNVLAVAKKTYEQT